VPLCRISYFELTDDEVCISSIQSIVNDVYEEVITEIEGECVASHVGVDELANGGVDLTVFPNPFSDYTTMRVVNRFNTSISATITDVTGKTVRDLGNITANQIVINRNDLSPGLYFVQVMDSQRVLNRQRLIVQ